MLDFASLSNMTSTKSAALLSCLGFLALAVGAPVSKGLPPFSTVDVCAPFNVQIAPGDNYTLDIDAESQVQEAVTGTGELGGFDQVGAD